MKLSPKEIQFIDQYLQQAGVIYVDIRYEMVDHVASAVEEKMKSEQLDFYESFKQYMVLNKKELLQRKGSIYSRTVMISFLKFMVHPLRLVMAVLLFTFFKYVDVNAYFPKDFTVRNLFFVIILIIAAGQSIYIHFILKKRFFMLERLGGVMAFIYYFQLFFLGHQPEAFILTVMSYVLLVYLQYFVQGVRKFNLNRKLYAG
ncbi:MAG TPA: hypothetical protein VLB74_07745 [Flavobacterium sp.]|uniref:hypothetical protein n=1 Tax=Flavobacterium sp. TaxID=239 RepID=UPI002C3BDEEE|nr:hypothetical protein [Flavobacterium sp.]HSD14525.1 hypothetical protein [Flavobacterium sp.]